MEVTAELSSKYYISYYICIYLFQQINFVRWWSAVRGCTIVPLFTIEERGFDAGNPNVANHDCGIVPAGDVRKGCLPPPEMCVEKAWENVPDSPFDHGVSGLLLVIRNTWS